MIAGGVVVADQRQHALRHAAHDAVGEHVHLLGDAQSGLHRHAAERHQVIEYGVGDVLQQRHQAGGQAAAEHGEGDALREHAGDGSHAQDGAAARPAHQQREVEQGDEVGERCGDRCAENLLPARQQHEHEQRVKRDVEQTAEHDANAGLRAAPLRTDEVRQQRAHGGAQPAECDGDGQVAPRLRVHRGVRAAQRVDERVEQQEGAQRVQQRREQAAPEGKGGGALGALMQAAAQRAGYDARAADTEEVRDGGEKHERRCADRDGADHRVAAGQSDEKRVRHVVDDEDGLTDDGRQGQTQYGAWDGAAFKQCAFPGILMHGLTLPFCAFP